MLDRIFRKFVNRHIRWYAFDATNEYVTAGPYPRFLAKGIARYMTKRSENQWDYHWDIFGA